MRWRARHRGPHAERGAAAVEFAIVAVVLLLILFAIIDFGRLLFVKQGALSASREGARVAVTGSTNSAVLDAIENAGGAAAALAGGSTIASYWAVNWAGTDESLIATAIEDNNNKLCASSGNSLSIRTTIPFTWFTPVGLFGLLDRQSGSSGSTNWTLGKGQVSASTTMRCE